MKWFRKAIDCGAEWAKVEIASIYRNNKEYSKAIKLYNYVIDLCENLHLYSNYLVFGEAGQKRPGMTEEAKIYSIDWYELIGDTIYWDAICGRGYTYELMGDNNKAFDDYFKCFQISVTAEL